MSPLQTPTELQPSCGTVLSVTWEPSIKNGLGLAYDVLTGQRVEFDPYKDFRCSSDRKVVVGWENPDHKILKVGTSAERTLYAAAKNEPLVYDVSPNGEYTVYNTIEYAKGKLCLIRTGEETRCIEEGCGISLSVSDSGAVLIGTAAAQVCYYKDSNHFSPTPRPGYTETDGCPAVDYWNPRDKSSSLVESLGRNPQWITPDAAAALRAWRSHESAVLDY
jgi:hypothetical protein